MSDTVPSTETTAKKQQSLLHVGSVNRDALEAIGATYDPPMRWQDLARVVLKNFIQGSQHDEVLKRVQTNITINGEAIADAVEKHLLRNIQKRTLKGAAPLTFDGSPLNEVYGDKHVLRGLSGGKFTAKQLENEARTDFDLSEGDKDAG